MKRTRITEKIEYIDPMHMKNFTACAGVIINAGKKVLIDTNLGPEETEHFLAQEKPDMAFITHFHIDHSTWGYKVLEYSDAEFYVPAGEEKYLSDIDEFLGDTAGRCGCSDEWRDFIINITHYHEIHDFKSFDYSYELALDGLTLKAVDSAGHSPFHTSYYIPEEKIFISGDIGLDRYGPWYGWPNCDLPRMYESLLRCSGMDISVALTSHSGIYSKNIKEEFDRCISMIPMREKKIMDMLDQGHSHGEIIADGIFYRKKELVREPVRSHLYTWDSVMLDHHLELIKMGGTKKLFNK